jgi:hypothetical protein
MQKSFFGIPTVLTLDEMSNLIDDLENLWGLTYSAPADDLEIDLQKCKRFFDPLARGFSLRERLSELPQTPQGLFMRLAKLGSPLVLEIGDRHLIVGAEARLLLSILRAKACGDDHIVLTSDDIMQAQERALDLYRELSSERLNQVIKLRRGEGKEVMQAPSVGLVVALLVNRSTARERAIVDQRDTPEGELTNTAIHSGAIRFAEAITPGRRKSAGEQRLRGGYIISEARRRLAHRLIVEDMGPSGSLIYVPEKFRAEVIGFIARDLARRPALTEDKLRSALNALVVAHRSVASDLANQALSHERPADTSELLEQILTFFRKAKDGAKTIG